MEKPLSELLNFSIINLDKPSGPTSFWVSQFVKKSLNLKKTSHFGTLDPQVSGVLPIALGRACKLNDILMHKNKTYVGIMRLHSKVSSEKLNQAIEKNIGKIMQLPPVRSSVKRQLREREIKTFKVLEIGGKDILFETEVQAGTYIRKLCVDIGAQIGGAHMLELRRVKAGLFSEEEKNFISLYDFEKSIGEYKKGNETPLRKILIPAEDIIRKNIPSVILKEAALKPLLTGKPLMETDIAILPENKTFAAFYKEKFIGIYTKSKEPNNPEIIARPNFVFN
jgi:H/ACA ribonucleoprotein complex subunit 4